MNVGKYKDRLRSLGGLTRCNKPLLAREGWYYTGTGRRVKCCACHIEIDIGRFGKGIIEKHLDKSPDCKLAQRRQYLRTELAKARSRFTLFATRSREEEYPLDAPRLPAMADAYRRGYTFEISYLMGNASEMASAGFFWSHTKQKVICFYCGGCFELEEVQRNSKVQHARFRPQCDYINRYLGTEVVQMVQEHFCQEEVPDELITNITAPRQEPEVAKSEAKEDQVR